MIFLIRIEAPVGQRMLPPKDLWVSLGTVTWATAYARTSVVHGRWRYTIVRSAATRFREDEAAAWILANVDVARTAGWSRMWAEPA